MEKTFNKGLLIKFEVLQGKAEEAEAFLQNQQAANQHAGQSATFIFRFSSSAYGLFIALNDQEDFYLNGPLIQAMNAKMDILFKRSQENTRFDILADKLPYHSRMQDSRGLLLTFRAKEGHELDAEEFLMNAKPLVMAESETSAWFAIRLGKGEYGIFDVFPDNTARLKHLTGKIPRELAKHAFTLLGNIPDIDMLTVIAEDFPLASRPGISNAA